MRFLQYIFFLILFLNFSFVTNKTKVTVTSKSEIVIKGTSNVNSFECKYNSKLIEEVLEIQAEKSNGKTVIKGAKIAVNSNGFDCANKLITKDFKTTLKADKYQNIYLDLKEISEAKNEIKTKVEVEIAGIKKEYEVPVKFDEKKSQVAGELSLNIKDFKLKSPKKLLGLITLNDNVKIKFNLHLKF